MKNKTRWFIKAIGEFTNGVIMDWLTRSGDHQDGIAAQEIIIRGKKEKVIEVPSYDIIKNLFESAKSTPLKFKIFFMPPGAKHPGPWTLKAFQKNNCQSLLKIITSQAKP